MTIERMNEMLEAIRANEVASKRLDQLFNSKMNGFAEQWSVEEIVESVFNKFCTS